MIMGVEGGELVAGVGLVLAVQTVLRAGSMDLG